MKSILFRNDGLAKMITRVGEAAAIVSRNMWAEGRCGCFSADVTEFMPEDAADMISISPEYSIGKTVEHLKGRYYFCSGKLASMRDFSRYPMEHGSIVRINDACNGFEAVADKFVRCSEEFAAHLSAYEKFAEKSVSAVSIAHVYPLETEIALKIYNGDVARLLEDAKKLAPEHFRIFKKGIGLLETSDLSGEDFVNNLAQQLSSGDITLLPSRGVISYGREPASSVDKISAFVHVCKLLIRIN